MWFSVKFLDITKTGFFMNQKEIEVYLREFHGRAVEVMNDVLRVERPVSPVRVYVRAKIGKKDIVSDGGYDSKRGNRPAKIVVTSTNKWINNTLGEMEYTCAHETGHHFHNVLNERLQRVYARRKREWRFYRRK